MEPCALQLIYVCDSDFHNGIGISRFFLTIPIHTHKIKKLNFVILLVILLLQKPERRVLLTVEMQVSEEFLQTDL